MGHSSSEILDLYYHLHDDESQHAMQALAMTHSAITGGNDAGTGSQHQAKTVSARDTRGAENGTSWVSFGTQHPATPEGAPQTAGNTAVAEGGSNEAERGWGCGLGSPGTWQRMSVNVSKKGRNCRRIAGSSLA